MLVTSLCSIQSLKTCKQFWTELLRILCSSIFQRQFFYLSFPSLFEYFLFSKCSYSFRFRCLTFQTHLMWNKHISLLPLTLVKVWFRFTSWQIVLKYMLYHCLHYLQLASTCSSLELHHSIQRRVIRFIYVDLLSYMLSLILDRLV